MIYTKVPIEQWQSYGPRLDYARQQGYLNRTVFCFGFLLGKSAINPNGWTKEALRASLVSLKADYPELAGVAMYSRRVDL